METHEKQELLKVPNGEHWKLFCSGKISVSDEAAWGENIDTKSSTENDPFATLLASLLAELFFDSAASCSLSQVSKIHQDTITHCKSKTWHNARLHHPGGLQFATHSSGTSNPGRTFFEKVLRSKIVSHFATSCTNIFWFSFNFTLCI